MDSAELFSGEILYRVANEMPTYEGMMLTGEKNAIVFDIGHAYTKYVLEWFTEYPNRYILGIWQYFLHFMYVLCICLLGGLCCRCMVHNHRRYLSNLHSSCTVQQIHHHSGDQADQRQHMLYSICIHSFRVLPKAVQLFIASFYRQPMCTHIFGTSGKCYRRQSLWDERCSIRTAPLPLIGELSC